MGGDTPRVVITQYCVTRLKDPSAIEARLLELAHTTEAKITAPILSAAALP